MKKTELTKREIMNPKINDKFNYLNSQELGFMKFLQFLHFKIKLQAPFVVKIDDYIGMKSNPMMYRVQILTSDVRSTWAKNREKLISSKFR